MLKHGVKGLYKKGFWDHGGTLNEIDPPSEMPERDKLKIENWKVHEDGKSVVKRPGYTKLDTGYVPPGKKVRDIQEYVDYNKDKKIIVVTEDSVIMRKEVAGYELKYTDNFGAVDDFSDMEVFNGKLTIFNSYDQKKGRVYQSQDGVTWVNMGEYTSPYDLFIHGNCLQVFNNKLFISMGANNSGAGNPRVLEWNGSSFTEHLTSLVNKIAWQLIPWDGRLWVIIDPPSFDDGHRVIYYYNGVTWNPITNYGGNTSLLYNKAYVDPHAICLRGRVTRFFIWNGELYVFATSYNSGGAKWAWEIWKFNAATYDRFTKVFDSDGFADDYALSSVFSLGGGKVYVVGNKYSDSWPTNNSRVYSSENLTSWQIEGTFTGIGFPCSEKFYNGKMFFNIWDASTKYTKVYYYDELKKNFILEGTISTNPMVPTFYPGAVDSFLGGLYIGKRKEIYKRVITTTEWTDIFTSEKKIDIPISSVSYQNLLLISGFGQNIVIEGDVARTLGIVAPATAPTVAQGAAGELTGIYKFVVTFCRSGNYPCESNPSPESAAITVGIVGTLHRARTTNVATIGTASAHGLAVSEAIVISDMAGTGYNGTWVVASVLDSTHFTYVNTGTDEAEIADTNGKITSKKKIRLTNIPTSDDPKVNQRRIYRTTAGGEEFYWQEDIDNNTGTEVESGWPDESLGDPVSYDRLPPPEGKYFEVWDNRLWIAGNTDYPDMVFFTNTGTAEEWSPMNFLQFKKEVMMIKAMDDMYALRRDGASRIVVSGESLYEVKDLIQAIGTDAPFSVAVCDTLMIWKSEFGIEVFNGDRCYRPILSRYVQRTLASINKKNISRIVGGHNAVDNKYWLAIPTGTAETDVDPDKVVVFDYIKNNFTIYKFAKGLTYLTSLKDSGENLLFLIGSPDGYVYINGVSYTDDGALISANFRTAWFNVTGERELWNVLRRMFIKYMLPTGKAITMNVYRDFKKDAIATITLDGSTPTIEAEIRNEIMRRINFGVKGYHLSFEFINNQDAGGECRVIGWDSYFKRRIWKRTVKGD